MTITIEALARPCALCGQAHPGAEERGSGCDALRVAGEAGARPAGVPVRVQAAYVEARQALRADAPEVAVRVLRWLLAHLADTRGVKQDLSFSAKMAALADAGIISMPIRKEVLVQEHATAPTPGTAWALMTLTEHALARAYLRRGAT